MRRKLLLIVGTALISVGTVVGGSALIGAGQTRTLDDVESRLVPKLELGPRLEAEFEHLRQDMQDAVAAQDRAGLDTAGETRDRLFGLVGGAGGALTPSEAASLRWSVQEYYGGAREVSRRLIEGETGEAIVEDMARMQAQQAKTGALIKRITRLDKGELASGFAAMRISKLRADRFRLAIGLGTFALFVALSFWASRAILGVLGDLSDGFSRFATGDFSQPIPVISDDDLNRVARDANQMAVGLRRLNEQRDHQDWLKEGQVGLSNELRGELDVGAVTERALWFLARRLGARAGALYLAEKDGTWALSSHYGLVSNADSESSAPRPTERFRSRDGLVGQAAQADEIFVVDDLPADYLSVQSGLGQAPARSLVLVPLLHWGKPIGVMELALFAPATDRARELLLSVRQSLVLALDAAQSRASLRALLEQAQRQAERLVAQEEELRLNNQELQAQQENLKSANEELEAQRRELSVRNAELEDSRQRVQQKADELAQASSYKSQFLANMSHELRTPLNSMLLLSHLLAENESNNLTPKQVEYCRTVHAAGQDLLSLINQVLDLAKIEAGRQDVLFQIVELRELADHAKRVFEPLASEKGIALRVEIAPEVPRTIKTDQQRFERILTNLLSNAIKFTEQGEVTLKIRRPLPGTRFARSALSEAETIAFVVSDTGIGIAPDAHERVFAPFEQVESNAQRRYAGTGLGLAIARESAGLLGGELTLESDPGRGSTFTCYLPERPGEAVALGALACTTEHEQRAVPDDRAALAPSESHLLIIEDDSVLAEQLIDIIHARRFKVIVAANGKEGLRLARERRPRGIILDVKLPDIDGWTVMDRLRQDPVTRSIPVHFVSAVDAPDRGLALGAVGYLTKPATRSELSGVVRALTPSSGSPSQRILVVEDNTLEGASIVGLLQKENLEACHVASAEAALTALERERFGCMVLDLGLPDMDGLGLLETLRARPEIDAPQVVVHTGRALTKKETRQLEAYTEAVILKDGRSTERLLDEIRLFVRHLKERLPPEQQSSVTLERRGAEVSLAGLKILVAEDDMRTVYALSALLRGKGADVLVADTGREALTVLSDHPDIHGVLMDVMMPEMDGYEATKLLRRDSRFTALPVIALTAKAMKGERERCLEAGASEYLTKPVDSERLLATLSTLLMQAGSNATRRTT